MTAPYAVLSADAQRALHAALQRIVDAESFEDAEWEGAWYVVYQCTQPYILRLCQRRLGAAADAADDVCQEVYRRAAGEPAFARFAVSPDAFLAYLSKVASHRCIDHLRALQRRPEVSLDASHEQVSSDSGRAIQDPMALETVDDLVDRLARLGLPLGGADHVLLRAVVEGIAPETMAGQLGITKSALAVRLHRLRAKMRKCIAESEL